MSRPTQKPTMRDVSRLARVSPMTVSRVFTDPDTVAAPTRERVLKAVEQLGYLPDLVAGALSSRRTNFVGLILPTLTNSNFGDTAQGLAEVLKADATQLLIGYTLYQVAEEERLVRALLPRRPDAIVIAGSVHTAATRTLLDRAGIPVVEIWEQPDHPLDRAVGFSNFEVGRAAARHLIALGHRRIGAIGPEADADLCDHRADARLKGFASMLREAGLSDALVMRHGLPPASFEHGANAIGALLALAPDVEAVFAVSDLAAFGAMMELKRRGIDVPGQISLMGFGNFEVGRLSYPAMTTIGVDARAIGAATGTMLRALLKRDAQEAEVERNVDVGFTLIERETTAPRPAAPAKARKRPSAAAAGDQPKTAAAPRRTQAARETP
ncbi:LacI family DNA-binding transcriptional regulator [Xanthobacter oligotrophicus]|uniref:LacI family DNA-binding transcriptional regulator n=1 Tax=Xanthobacter oligotrophicus TaxID=2607286 RepID=A0ABW7A1P3_9HYPH